MIHDLPNQALDAVPGFCRKWRIAEFSLFGSVLTPTFGPSSDVDILVDFAPGPPWGIDEWIAMRDELEAMFARRVDLVSKSSLRNPFRRSTILNTRKVLHAA